MRIRERDGLRQRGVGGEQHRQVCEAGPIQYRVREGWGLDISFQTVGSLHQTQMPDMRSPFDAYEENVRPASGSRTSPTVALASGEDGSMRQGSTLTERHSSWQADGRHGRGQGVMGQR